VGFMNVKLVIIKQCKYNLYELTAVNFIIRSLYERCNNIFYKTNTVTFIQGLCVMELFIMQYATVSQYWNM
jgi:hypothetical protein